MDVGQRRLSHILNRRLRLCLFAYHRHLDIAFLADAVHVGGKSFTVHTPLGGYLRGGFPRLQPVVVPFRIHPPLGTSRTFLFRLCTFGLGEVVAGFTEPADVPSLPHPALCAHF